MTSSKIFLLAAAAVACMTVPKAKADFSICDAVAGNLVQNCGFESGTYTSTVGGNTNANVPVDWVANAAFNLETGFNQVRNVPNSGTSNLSISNFDYQPLATLSQTFADVSGASYSGSFFAYDDGANGDANAFLQLQVNGASLVTLNDTVAAYQQFGFTFTGTGSDTLTIAAQTDPAEWYVDDVVVTGQTTAATPEPALGPLLALLAAFLVVARLKMSGRLSRKAAKGFLPS
jgi:hypothetical protein